MDLKLVREEAIAATARFFAAEGGLVPDEDSDEWETEYRRQFELARERHRNGEGGAAVDSPADGAVEEPAGWAPLTGAPTQIRWAASLRAERIKEIRDPGVRDWLATTWTRAKSWIDTQDLPAAVFLQRIAPHYREYRDKTDEAARLTAQQRRAQQAAADEIRREVEAAGITAAGLVELIDICDRLPPVALKAKLAELDHDGRNLRVFETADAAFLMVLEKDANGRSDYAVERDEGLVADLALFMRAAALS